MKLSQQATAGRDGHRRSSRPAAAVSSAPRVYRFWFALPSMALIAIFFALPFLANAVLSFTRWTGYSSQITFNGLDNFASLFALGILGHATLVTIGFAITTMFAQNLVGLALAKALQRSSRGNGFFRSVFFIPVLISPLAAGYIWGAILAANGPVNQFLSWLTQSDVNYAWLGDSGTALIMVGLIDAWKWSGLVTLVYIGGLNTIDRSVIEASVIDGAGFWKRFFAIEFPLLAPAFTFNIVLTLVGSFNAIDVVFATTKGGPGNATALLNVAVYNQFGQGLYGTSSALSFMIALLVIVAAVPLMWSLRKREVQS